METLNKDYTSALVLNNNGNMLMQLKDKDYPYWPNCWATFGGGIKNGETPLGCIIREFDNETGIKIENFEYFCEKDFDDESKLKLENKIFRSGRIYYFSAKISDADSRKIKITEGAWYDFFNRWQLERLRIQDSIVPYQHDIIKKFFESLK